MRLTALGRWAAGAGTVGLVLGGAAGRHEVFAVGVAVLVACSAAWAGLRFGRRPGVVPARPPTAVHVRGEPFTVHYRPTGPHVGRYAPFTVGDRLRSVLPDTPDTALTGRGLTAGVAALPRGVWRLGPAVAEYRDALGLAVRRSASSGSSAPFTVRPRVPDGLPWVAGADAAHTSGAARLDTDEAFEIHGVRAYTPGDDLRFVDWRGSLIAGSFQVRELRGGGFGPAAVLLDTAVAGGEAFETAVDCAAAVAVSVLRLGRPVELGGLGGLGGVGGLRGPGLGGGPRRLTPGPGAADGLLDLFARVRPRPGASPDALARQTAGIGGGALAVLATTRDPAAWRPLLSALSSRRATVLCLHAVPRGAAPSPPSRQFPGFQVLRVTTVDDLATPPATGPARGPLAARGNR